VAEPAREGLIFPRVPALAARRGEGGLEITNLASRHRMTLEGRFAEELAACWETGRLGPVLQALPETHRLRELCGALQAGPRLVLTPHTALLLERLDTLFLELTGACPARCAHCYADAHEAVGSALDRSTCEAVIREAAALGVRRIQLTGGEPLLCSFLPELVSLCAALDVPTCEIFTNGLLLDDDALARLAPHRPAFAFSFYSHEPAVHDGITRTPGSHRLTRAAIERCVAAGLELRVAIIVMAANASQVADTVAYVKALGVEQVRAAASTPVGRGELFTGPFATGEAPGQAAGKGRDHLGKLCVSHDGAVYPCIFNRSTPLGRVPDRTISEILQSPLLPPADDRSDEEFCETIDEQLACVECRLTALALRALAKSRY